MISMVSLQNCDLIYDRGVTENVLRRTLRNITDEVNCETWITIHLLGRPGGVSESSRLHLRQKNKIYHRAVTVRNPAPALKPSYKKSASNLKRSNHIARASRIDSEASAGARKVATVK
jgi:hypothetical protein